LGAPGSVKQWDYVTHMLVVGCGLRCGMTAITALDTNGGVKATK